MIEDVMGMNKARAITFFGAPLDCGQPHVGTRLAPAFLRAAGLINSLEDLGHHVTDEGDITVNLSNPQTLENYPLIKNPGVCAHWYAAMIERWRLIDIEETPIFLGGDHFMSAASIPAMVERAERNNAPLFVLWLDAHPDFHTLETTQSGNLHGTSLAYAAGQDGFESLLPMPHAIAPANVMMLGLRSIDRSESLRLREIGLQIHDMRSIDEQGIVGVLDEFLDRVMRDNGHLHISFDLDFLDPVVAPAVGTPVRGGVSLREAHLVMEQVHDSGLLTSLDLVELNPLFDHCGTSTQLMIDLTASLFGRCIQPV